MNPVTVSTIIVPVVVALIGVFGVIVASRLNRKLNASQQTLGEIHVLVNSRLDNALRKISSLEDALGLPRSSSAPAAPLIAQPLPPAIVPPKKEQP